MMGRGPSLWLRAGVKLESERHALEIKMLANDVLQEPSVVRLNPFGIVTTEDEHGGMAARLRRVIDFELAAGRYRMRQYGIAHDCIKLGRWNAAIEVLRHVVDDPEEAA